MSDPSTLCVAVDVGGTKISAAVVDRAGRVHPRTRVVRPTPHGDSAAVLAAVACAAAAARDAEGRDAAVQGLGVAVPGIVDRDSGAVRSATATLPGWSGTRVSAGLSELTRLPSVVDNDVRAMAAGELHFGVAKGLADVLFVSVGTGVGGAVVLEGRVLAGPHSAAGSIAHLLVPVRGALACGCGRIDHVEAVASGPAIEAAYRERSGDAAGVAEIAVRAAAGSGDAVACLSGAAEVLGRALAGVVGALDVTMVVIGGGVALAGDAFLRPLAGAFRAEVLPPLADVRVVAAALGTDAPLVGAASWLWESLHHRAAAAS